MNIYMETPVFTPDSSRFVFQHLLDLDDPTMNFGRRHYWLCDINDNFALRQLTDEDWGMGCCVSPDGRWMYYFINELDASRGGIELRRVSLDTFQRESVMRLEKLSRVYPLGTISSDGKRICTRVFMGDGRTADAPWGVLVCDVAKGEGRVVAEAADYGNLHPQYCRSLDAQASHDILIQQNHGMTTNAAGDMTSYGTSADVHVISDDGTNLRGIPCGRTDDERVHGHQCWRGRMLTVATGVDWRNHQPPIRPIIETPACAITSANADDGERIPGGIRNDITRDVHHPAYGHFAFDPTGTKFVGDNIPPGKPAYEAELHIGTLPATPDAAMRVQYLLKIRSNYSRPQYTHPHPFLSPDGRRAFFNKDDNGVPQVWMVEGFEYPD